MDGNREPIVFICNEQCKELELEAMQVAGEWSDNQCLTVCCGDFSAIMIAIYLDNRKAIAYFNRCGDGRGFFPPFALIQRYAVIIRWDDGWPVLADTAGIPVPFWTKRPCRPTDVQLQ